MTSNLYHIGISSKAMISSHSDDTLYLRPLNYYTNNKAGQCHSLVVVGLSLWQLGFHLRLFHMESVVDTVAVGHVFSPSTSVVPYQHHYANALYSFIQQSSLLHNLCKRQYH